MNQPHDVARTNMEHGQAEAILHPQAIISELKKNSVTHVVWLPDSETNFMYEQLMEDPALELVPVSREGETMAIAAGLWVGGKRPVALIQNTGIFESGDSIRGLGLDVDQPLVMLVGYRGWDRHGITRDSAAKFTEHILHAWGISYYLVETDNDASRISLAMEEAERTCKPVAVLVGTEFGT
ncbi:MAG: thiamine pyrophosphate-binding protein [Chloroflexi bacterium]|nr:thiamine pyrophosphate-binding protein [Chloroflexota bacterium]